MTDKWLKVGKVGKSHGLRGAFFISGREEGLSVEVSSVKVGDNVKTAQSFDVEKITKQSGRPLLKLKGLDNRNQSEEFLHKSIWVQRSELDIDEDEYFWADVVNKPVSLPDGKIIGKVLGINNFGASDVVEIINEDKQTLMLPFVSQYFDLDTSVDNSSLLLVVENEVIEELWTGGKDKKAKPKADPES